MISLTFYDVSNVIDKKAVPISIDTVVDNWASTTKVVLFSLKNGVQTTKVIRFITLPSYWKVKNYISTKNLSALYLVSGSLANSSPGIANFSFKFSPLNTSIRGII